MSEYAIEPIPSNRIPAPSPAGRIIAAARAAGAGNCVVVPITSRKELNALRAALYGSRHINSGERVHVFIDPSEKCVRVWISTHDVNAAFRAIDQP